LSITSGTFSKYLQFLEKLGNAFWMELFENNRGVLVAVLEQALLETTAETRAK